MPAVTVDNVLALPRIDRPRPRPPASGRWCRSPAPPAASRGRASPCGGPSPASTWPSSTRSSTWTRWARWSTARASPRARRGTPTAGFETATYIIDGTFEHQDNAGGGGVITNGDTQWMTAGAGHPAHRAPAGGAGAERGDVPRPPAVGEPAQGQEVGGAPLPGHPRRPGHPAHHARRRGPGAGDRGRHRRPRRPRRHPHADGLRPRHPQPGGGAGPALAARLQRPRLRPQRRGHGGTSSGTRQAAVPDGPAGGVRQGRLRHRAPPPSARRAAAPTST